MAYFPHAYKKVFVGSWFMTEGTTVDTLGGGFGFFDPKTWTAIATADADVKTYPEVVLVLGSYRSVDYVGPYGGYQESLKSQPINAYNIERFWKVGQRGATPQTVLVGWDMANASTAPQFLCGTNYSLRIDLKGGPAVRLLGHNFYKRFDVMTDCCADGEDSEAVDPVAVLLEFAKQIKADPIMSQFVTPTVLNADGEVDPDAYTALTDEADIEAATGALVLQVSYTDTLFSTCSFDVMDSIAPGPVLIGSAQLVDEIGDACPKQLTFTEAFPGVTAEGTGELILRDVLLSDSYRHEFFYSSARRRSIEDVLNILGGVPLRDPDTLYNSYYILYSVPRKSNPTGVYDNDQYLVQLVIPEGSDFTEFETWMENYLESAGEGVVLEDLSGASGGT
jgi:hypothetical protein